MRYFWLAVGMAWAWGAAAQSDATFTVLDAPPGDFQIVEAMDVSADGSLVGGRLLADRRWEAVVWKDGEPLRLAAPGDPAFVPWLVRAVSDDGRVAVGWGAVHGERERAFRWTAETGLVMLPTPDGTRSSRASAVSADAGIIAGQIEHPDVVKSAAALWRGDTFSHFGEEGTVRAEAASGDGGIIGGYGFASIFSGRAGWEPFVLELGGDLTALGDFRPSFSPSGTVHGLSFDGRVAVGRGRHAHGSEAFRWTEREGLTRFLPRLAGQGNSTALDVTGDGGLAVGSVGIIQRAVLLDRFHGVLLLDSLLEDGFGLDLDGWILTRIVGVSDDGAVVTGTAGRSDGPRRVFVATLPPRCDDGLDNDGDALVDFPDDPGCLSPEDRWEVFRDDAVISIDRPRWPPSTLRTVLYGSEELDVDLVDLASLGLGEERSAPIHKHVVVPHLEDEDRDGIPDLVLHFFESPAAPGEKNEPVCLSGSVDLVGFEACATPAQPAKGKWWKKR